MRKFAQRLIDYDEAEDNARDANAPPTFRVTDKLRPYLSTLMGTGGFQALLSRALSLAAAEVPWLKAVHVETDGTLAGLEDVRATLHAEDFFEGRVVLLARLLGLMTSFIGEILTLRLVREVWSQVPLNDLDFGNGDKNEKEK